MTKYIVTFRPGFGRYKVGGKVKPVSESKAKELKEKGYKIFNSKREAEDYKEQL